MTSQHIPAHLGRRALLGGIGAAGLAAAFTAADPTTVFALGSKAIQKSLWGLYYYDGVIDGDLGSMTKTAVRAFQKDRGLVVDGSAAAKTQAELTTVVKQVQAKLGLVKDGDYGSVTVTAVKKFQGSKKLVADGRSGAKTMSALGVRRVVSPTQPSTGKLVVIDQMATGAYSSSNCGPTAMVIAMVAIGKPPKGYSSDMSKNAAPVQAARKATGHPTATGMDLTWLKTGLTTYGVSSKQVTFSAGLDAAAKGRTVIFNVNHKKLLTGAVQSGDYGHYVVSNGRDSSGSFRVSDPGRAKSLGIKSYTRSRLQYAERYNRALIVG